MPYRFTVNGTMYAMNRQAYRVITNFLPHAESANDYRAITAVIEFGLLTGRVERTINRDVK